MSDQATGLLSGWLRSRRLAAARPYCLGRVLDYGCGVGRLAQHCLPHAYLGFDHDQESISTARQLHPQHRFVAHLNGEQERFDHIILLAVIEHVPNPQELLSRIKHMLAPDGKIILTTPHARAEWVHRAGAKLGLFSKAAADEHDTLFDRELMERLARQAGLKIVLYRKFMFRMNQLFVLVPND